MKIETLFNLPDGFKVNKYTLSFIDSTLEEGFKTEFFYSALKSQRLSILVALILFSLFGILDLYLFSGEPLKNILLIRFAIGVPTTLLLLILSFTPIFKKYWQPIVTIAITIVGLSIVGIILNMPSPVRDYNFPGLMLVLFYSFVVLKLRFIYSIVSSFIITSSYMIAAITLTDVSFNNYFNNSFFFIAANVMGLFSSYMIELYERKEYFLRITLENEKNNVRELLTREQSVSQIKTRFINVTSHVFRNPLTAIISSNQVLSSIFNRDGNKDGIKFNQYISDSANELLNLLNRVQFLTKYDSGDISFYPVAIDLNPIIENSISKVMKSENKKFKIEKEFINNSNILTTDVNTIEIAIGELLSNAVKHSPIDSTINIVVEKIDANTSIKIIDEGIGFDKNLYESIDTSFNYSKDTQISGLGLGFAILKICMIILDAEIKFYPNQDIGMTAELLIKNYNTISQ